jgi:hypothetical protein
MDLHPTVIDVQDPGTGDSDVQPDSRYRQRVHVACTGTDRVGLGDRPHTDRLEDQVTVFGGYVHRVDVLVLPRIQPKKDVNVAVLLCADDVDRAVDCHAGGKEVESTWIVDMGMRISAGCCRRSRKGGRGRD